MAEIITPVENNQNKTDVTPVTPATEVKEQESLLDQGKVKSEADSKDKSLLDTASEETKQAEIKTLKEQIEKSTDEAEKKTLQEKLDKLSKPAEVAKEKTADVPEKYEFKAPEGMTLDEALIAKVTPVFKDLKLSQEQAQKLVDVYSEQVKAIETTQKANFDKFMKESSDETIKALGADYKKELAFAAKVRDRFFSPESVEFINASGLGNNKSFIQDLVKFGKIVSEDAFVEGHKAELGNKNKTLGEVMYPNQAQK